MNARGNAFIYILIAIALFGALTFALSDSEESGSIGELGEGRAEIAANEILSYAAAAQNSITALNRIGTGPAALDFIMPSEGTFNTAPVINKLFHPEGGGLAYKALPRDAIVASVTSPDPAYFIGRFSNTEWTPSTADDVIFTAYGINRQTCEALNLKILGASAPLVSDNDMRAYLIESTYGGVANDDLDTSNCAACEEITSACVTFNGVYAFYAVLVPR